MGFEVEPHVCAARGRAGGALIFRGLFAQQHLLVLGVDLVVKPAGGGRDFRQHFGGDQFIQIGRHATVLRGKFLHLQGEISGLGLLHRRWVARRFDDRVGGGFTGGGGGGGGRLGDGRGGGASFSQPASRAAPSRVMAGRIFMWGRFVSAGI